MGAKGFAIWSPTGPNTTAQSALAAFYDTVVKQHQGSFERRYAINIRSYRWQNSPAKASGFSAETQKPRVMVCVRFLNTDEAHLIIEDPLASTTQGSETLKRSHGRVTAAAVSSASFELLLKYSLPPTSGNPAANVQQASTGGWIQRPTTVSMDGFIISLGDFHINAVPGIITQKGGTAPQTASHVLLEIDYGPVPYLRSNAQYLFTELLGTFIPNMREVAIFQAIERCFDDASLIMPGSRSETENTEWTALHRSTVITAMLREKGLL